MDAKRLDDLRQQAAQALGEALVGGRGGDAMSFVEVVRALDAMRADAFPSVTAKYFKVRADVSAEANAATGTRTGLSPDAQAFVHKAAEARAQRQEAGFFETLEGLAGANYAEAARRALEKASNAPDEAAEAWAKATREADARRYEWAQKQTGGPCGTLFHVVNVGEDTCRCGAKKYSAEEA